MFLPVESTDRMRSKGDQIRGDPEKQHTVFNVVTKYLIEAVKVVLDGFDEAGLRKRFESEGFVGTTIERVI
jgi:hypothetical protein